MENRIFTEMGLGLLVSGFCVIIQCVILLTLFSSLRNFCKIRLRRNLNRQ